MPSTGVEAFKREAARTALQEVEPGMVLGLGTGSTVAHFLQLLGEALREGTVSGIVGVPTSVWTEDAAGREGIPLVALEDHPVLDLAVDGADEITPELHLIKGLGGALLREKMVAQAARRFVVIGDEGKAVTRLGTRSPLPVEVIAWSWQAHRPFLEELGAQPVLRTTDSGQPFVTDNGNVILDCRFEDGIADPWEIDRALAARAGVVEHGLFLGMAAAAAVAGPHGVRTVEADR